MFQTERLTVREWRDDDLEVLQSILGDPTTMHHWPEPLDEAAVLAWLRRVQASVAAHGFGRWACELRLTGAVIGDVGIMEAEVDGETVNDLGYIIHHPYWRCGYGLEAARGAVDWARAHGLDSVVANMAADNLPSVAVAEKLGMEKIRTFANPRNGNKETCLYRLELRM